MRPGKRLARGVLVAEPRTKLQKDVAQRTDRMQVWLDVDGAKTTPLVLSQGVRTPGRRG